MINFSSVNEIPSSRDSSGPFSDPLGDWLMHILVGLFLVLASECIHCGASLGTSVVIVGGGGVGGVDGAFLLVLGSH